ncbi:caspase recruitment domain-containing protein 14 [Callorhinchus milii]|uniref:caspase recruitment domain-containing protein 14 n=1 Tax=Callorhinchus milii TaxID=7868 RepID=UPI00045736A1|nr:caspase recruitment domain-containing protein 14 [Callorhinchus milii]|eukprot:gi/632943122/ref/XP_007886784.1/ PREDICTED: caspase recruitment domain-containing protein 14 [Callorhinchus milii]
MDVVPPGKLVIKDLDEEAIWDLIENHRHIITSKVRPCHITPYLRQCLVITETDEEEILFGPHLKHRCMRTGYLLDLLRSRGKKGGVAFLESLGFYNPEIYTLITGEEPTRECSSMLDEKGNLGMIQFLMNEVMKTHKWLGEEKCQKHQLHEKSQILEEQNQQLKKELESTKAMEANLSRMKMDWHRHHDEMFRLKEENYQILMRYTNTLQEKEMAVTRSRDLQQQVDNLIMENKKLIVKFDVERRMSLKLREEFKPKQDELLHLKEEMYTLRFRIQELQLNPVTIDILEQDRVEALEDRQEMMKEMNTLRLDLDQADQLRNEFLDEKENLLMECTTLKMDCNMYKEKIDSLQSQVSELQKERDEAYGARDEVQVQMSKMIIDKDLCRRQVIELQDTCRELNKEILQIRSNRARQDKKERVIPLREKPKLKRLPAVSFTTSSQENDSDDDRNIQSELCQNVKRYDNVELPSSVRSSFVEPPSKESIYRRLTEDDLDQPYSGRYSIDDDPFPSVDHCSDIDGCIENIPDVIPPLKKSDSSPQGSQTLNGSPPPPEKNWIFPPGIQRLRLLSRVSLVTFNGDSILDQIEIIGGNVTGIFIHNIKPESPALNSGLKTGFQIIMVEYNTQERKRTSLEDASLEEAVWTLKHIKGICSLSIRDNREVYQNLVENIEKKLVTSGDSFYIRANITFNKESGSLGGFTVQCNEILHITDSFFRRNSEWKAFRVNPHTMADMASGTIPNYYRAQKLLIGMIQNMAQQAASTEMVKGRKLSHKISSGQSKLVRIVSADISQRNPLWLSFDSDTINPDKDEDEQLPGNCFTLMPYSLVRPCHPPALRPVILVSTLIGKIVLEKLKDQKDYEKCEPECLRNEDYAEKERRGDIVGLKDIQNSLCSCFTRKAVEAVVAKNVHCLLELSLDCVRQLHRMEIYPIVIVIHMCEKNNKKLKKILHKYRVNEELLLKCAQREEGCLDKLPCLYHSIAPDAWNDLDSLINCVKTAVREEQKKIVWIEKAPL